MGVVEGLGQSALKGRRLLALFVYAARLLIQVSLALDVGVLEAVGPGADLARATFGQGFEI